MRSTLVATGVRGVFSEIDQLVSIPNLLVVQAGYA